MAQPSELMSSSAVGRIREVYRGRELKELAANLLAASETLLAELEQNAQPLPASFDGGMKLYDELRRFEIELITRALKLTGGHQLRAAKLLGVKTTTLNSKIRRYKLCAEEDAAPRAER